MLSLFAALIVTAWRRAKAHLEEQTRGMDDYADLRCLQCWDDYEHTGHWPTYFEHRRQHFYTPRISPDET